MSFQVRMPYYIAPVPSGIGVDLGMFSKLNLHIVNELFREIYSAHLQKKAGTELSPDERDIARATLCRERLAHLNK